MKTDKPSLAEQVRQVASTLAMHTAAMKPSFTVKDDVPQQMIEQAIEEGIESARQTGKIKDSMPDNAKEKALEGIKQKAISNLYSREVLMDQELATKSDKQFIRDFLKEESEKLGCKIEIEDWVMFQIK